MGCTPIKPSEKILTGRWIVCDGRTTADDVCQRIVALTKSHLVQVAKDESGWNLLYRDPKDGRLWELSYPQGELHGGGPPQLEHVTKAQAKRKFGDFD
jgi:hypothetical protein